MTDLTQSTKAKLRRLEDVANKLLRHLMLVQEYMIQYSESVSGECEERLMDDVWSECPDLMPDDYEWCEECGHIHDENMTCAENKELITE